MKWALLGLGVTLGAASSVAEDWPSPEELALRLRVSTRPGSRVARVDAEFRRSRPRGDAVPLTFTYGSCRALNGNEGAYDVVARDVRGSSDWFPWKIVGDAPCLGCISVWEEEGRVLVGRSEELDFCAGESPEAWSDEAAWNRGQQAPLGDTHHEGKGSRAEDLELNAFGAWFDDVARLDASRPSALAAEEAKDKRVAIVGAGISGLTTYLILHQAGLRNIQILEADDRLGGRIRTEYLTGGPFNYSYQELGAMRIPDNVKLSGALYNLTDHHLVFQLAEEINKVNKHDEHLSVDFIPFIAESPNGLVYRDGKKMENGLPPTQAQVAADSSLFPEPSQPESVRRLQARLRSELPGEDFLIEMAENIFKAHEHYLKKGPGQLPGDHWSEFSFIVNHLNESIVDGNVINKGNNAAGFMQKIHEQLVFNPNATFKTIDGGMSRLPAAFWPLIQDSTIMNAQVERIDWSEKTEQLTLYWRANYTERHIHNATFDYAVVSPPFTVLRRMRLPALPTTLRNAIDTMDFWSSCKVALEYRSRFWEHFANPIYGSCSTVTDIPGIGKVCYPSYDLNGTGPAVVLGLFSDGPPLGVDWAPVPEEQVVQYALDAMAEIHGEVARTEFTGKYRRVCWASEPFAGAGWASPSAGSHEIYLPEFFKTHKKMIFVGEHTSCTHAWVSSAVESGIRGGVQLLLDLGLVQEAKDAVEKWMGRWVSVKK